MKNYNYCVTRNKAHSSKWETIAIFKTEEEAKKFIYNNGVIGYTHRIERR